MRVPAPTRGPFGPHQTMTLQAPRRPAMTDAITTRTSANTTPATNTTNATERLTFGIDLGDRHSHLCVLAPDGGVVEESRLQTNPEAFRQRFAGCSRARIAIEAGSHSSWANSLLAELGHEVLVANPRKVRAIYSNDKRSDRVDAEQLARFARLDPKLLSPITQRGMPTRAVLAILRSRGGTGRRTHPAGNAVRGCVKPFGMRLAAWMASIALVRRADVVVVEQAAVIPLLEEVAQRRRGSRLRRRRPRDRSRASCWVWGSELRVVRAACRAPRRRVWIRRARFSSRNTAHCRSGRVPGWPVPAGHGQ